MSDATTQGDDSAVDGPDFEVRYHTDFVDIAPGFTQPVCRGTRDEIDRHIGAVAAMLGIETQFRTTIFWYNTAAEGAMLPEDALAWCSDPRGCYAGNHVVHTWLSILHHELVHAVVMPTWGRSDILFEEGIALGLDRIHGSPLLNVSTIYSVLGDEVPSEVAGGPYHGGGHFSRWLVDRFGPAKFRELFAPRLGASSTKEDVFAAAEEVYGVPFDELEAEYFATAPTVYPIPAFCDGLLEIPWVGDRWEMSLGTDCEAPYVFGPRDDDALNYVVTVIDVPADLVGTPLGVWIRAETTGFDRGESAEIWPCIEDPLYDVDPEIAEGTHAGNGGPVTFKFPGRYRLELPFREPGEVYMRLCPDNGKFPGAYPQDRTIDPENCVGD